jgi:hypothetical protein
VIFNKITCPLFNKISFGNFAIFKYLKTPV